ncbi:unnamed protein product, partial [Durusdinium trenchii]
ACGLLSVRDTDEFIATGVMHPEYTWAFLVPFFVALACFTVVAVRHGLHPSLESKYVLMMLSALMAVVVFSVLTVFFPYAGPVLAVGQAVLEGLLAFWFGGLLVFWATERGGVEGVEAALMAHPRGKHRVSCCWQYFLPFETGHLALRHWRRHVEQYLLIKTLTQLNKMVYSYTTGSYSKTSIALFLGIINTLSLLLMLKALFNLHQSFRTAKLLDGTRAFGKFLVIKVTFSCLVINNLLVANLLSSGTVHPPAWVCEESNSASSVPTYECNNRLLQLVFLCEAVGLMALSVVFFSPPPAPKPDDDAWSWQRLGSHAAGHMWRILENQQDLRRAVKFARANLVLCITTVVVLTLSTLSPIWLTATVEGCKISFSFVSGTFCHGSCVLQADRSVGIQTKANALAYELYGVCNNDLPPETWAQAGAILSFLGLVAAVFGTLFRQRTTLVVTAVLGLVSAVLMFYYGPQQYDANVTMAALRKGFGASTNLTVGYGIVLQLLGVVAAVATIVLVTLVVRAKAERAQGGSSSSDAKEDGKKGLDEPKPEATDADSVDADEAQQAAQVV